MMRAGMSVWLAMGECYMQAGSLEDVGESQARDASTADAGASNEQLSRFMVCLVEAAPTAGQEQQGDAEFGLVAVETSTGAVLWDQFR